MVERERQRSRQRDLDVDVDVDLPPEGVETSRSPETTTSGGLRSRVREKSGSVLSGRSMLVSLALVVGGMLLIGTAVGLGTVGDLLGIVIATFGLGTVSTDSRYVEVGLAGAVAGGGSALFGNLFLSLVGVGIPLVVLGTLAGTLAGLVGHYFGRDLRDGLTREL